MEVDLNDIAAMRAEGDLPAYLRLVGGMNSPPPSEAEGAACLHCRAPVGARCTTPKGRPLASGVHPERGRERQVPSRNQHAPGAWPLPRGNLQRKGT